MTFWELVAAVALGVALGYGMAVGVAGIIAGCIAVAGRFITGWQTGANRVYCGFCGDEADARGRCDCDRWGSGS